MVYRPLRRLLIGLSIICELHLQSIYGLGQCGTVVCCHVAPMQTCGPCRLGALPAEPREVEFTLSALHEGIQARGAGLRGTHCFPLLCLGVRRVRGGDEVHLLHVIAPGQLLLSSLLKNKGEFYHALIGSGGPHMAGPHIPSARIFYLQHRRGH